jgi:hypothetical protein
LRSRQRQSVYLPGTINGGSAGDRCRLEDDDEGEGEVTSVFTIIRETQIKADKARDECEQELRADLADRPDELAFYLERLEQLHAAYKKRIVRMATAIRS